MLSVTSSFIDHRCVYVSAQKIEAFSKICCWLVQRFLDSYSPRNATARDESRNLLLNFGIFQLESAPFVKNYVCFPFDSRVFLGCSYT